MKLVEKKVNNGLEHEKQVFLITTLFAFRYNANLIFETPGPDL